LNFNKASGRLVAIYGHPWNLTWDAYRQQLGDHNVKMIKKKDGTRFYIYKGRRLTVHVDNRGNIISVDLVSASF